MMFNSDTTIERGTATAPWQRQCHDPKPDEQNGADDPALEITEGQVANLRQAARETVSLDKPVNEDSDGTLGQFVEDRNATTLDESVALNFLREGLSFALDTLSERESRVLRLRFRLDGGQARTLDEVGKVFGVTRERIRQIEVKAINKLRKPDRARPLRDFLE